MEKDKKEKTKSYLLNMNINFYKKIKFYSAANDLSINIFINNAINYYIENFIKKNEKTYDELKRIIEDYSTQENKKIKGGK